MTYTFRKLTVKDVPVMLSIVDSIPHLNKNGWVSLKDTQFVQSMRLRLSYDPDTAFCGAFDTDLGKMQCWSYVKAWHRLDGDCYTLGPTFTRYTPGEIEAGWQNAAVDLWNYQVERMRSTWRFRCYPFSFPLRGVVGTPPLWQTETFALSKATARELDCIPAGQMPINLLYSKYIIRRPHPYDFKVIELHDAEAEQAAGPKPEAIQRELENEPGFGVHPAARALAEQQ